MASFLTNLGRKHKISKRWLLGMPTSVKVEGLSTLHRLQTCICSETTPQDFQSLTLSLPSPPKVRLQLQTVTSQATGGSEPPDLLQWILHWNLHQNSQNSFFWGPFVSRRWHFPRKHWPSWCREGRLHSRPNFSVPVCKISEHERSLSHAGMPTHTQVDSAISFRSGEVARIIVIWAIKHTTLFSHQIGAFDLSRQQIVQKGTQWTWFITWWSYGRVYGYAGCDLLQFGGVGVVWWSLTGPDWIRWKTGDLKTCKKIVAAEGRKGLIKNFCKMSIFLALISSYMVPQWSNTS